MLADISASSAGPPRKHNTSSLETADSPLHHHMLNIYFTKFMHNLLRIFNSKRQLLDDRGPFIIRFDLLLLLIVYILGCQKVGTCEAHTKPGVFCYQYGNI